jgi:hypothetical protein
MKTFYLLLIVITLSVLRNAAGAEFEASRYKLLPTVSSWHDAEAQAKALGGDLLTINSQAEWDFVSKLFATSLKAKNVWIGATDEVSEGTFRWVSGEPFLFSNWNGGEPSNSGGNEDYVYVRTDGKWNDSPDTTTDPENFVGIVEFSSPLSFGRCDTFTLKETGRTAAPNNLALQSSGGVAFAKDALSNWQPFHSPQKINDGLYSDDSAWVADSLNSFAGVRFPKPQQISSIGFGRDNSGKWTDRSSGTYSVQYTSAVNPNESTPDSAWGTVGTVTNPGALRKLFCFPSVIATGIRIKIDATGFNSAGGGNGLDELEAYEAYDNTILEIYTASELVFFKKLGKTYQIESSSDLGGWSAVGAPIEGDNTEFSQLFSARNSTAKYYRLREL